MIKKNSEYRCPICYRQVSDAPAKIVNCKTCKVRMVEFSKGMICKTK